MNNNFSSLLIALHANNKYEKCDEQIRKIAVHGLPLEANVQSNDTQCVSSGGSLPQIARYPIACDRLAVFKSGRRPLMN